MEQSAIQPRFERYASAFTLSNTLEFLDLFKVPLPAFNLRGRDHIPTFFGAFTTVLVWLIVSVHGLSTFIQMMQRHNPNVSSFLEQQDYEDNKDALLNFRDQQIRLAFGVEGFFDHELKDSEEFVKIYTRLVYN